MGLCVLAIYVISGFFYWVAIRVIYPYQLDYGEGILLWQAQHASHLSTAYASIHHYPYIVFHYPPLYQIISLATSILTGDLLIAGRLVSAISCFGISVTLAWVVYCTAPKSASRSTAVGGAALAASSPFGLITMMFWTPLMRVDMLGLFFTFTGLSVFILARTAAQRYCAFALFVAAMYTRQSLIAGAVACLLVAGIMNLRETIKMFAFTALLGGTVMGVLSFATHGEIIKHLFLYNVNRFSIGSCISMFSFNLLLVAPIAPLAAVAAASPVRDAARLLSRRNAGRLRARLSSNPYRIALFTFTAYFILSGVVSLAAGKSGASLNYFLELDLAACALASLLTARRVWWHRPKRAKSKAGFSNALPMLFIGFQALTVSALVYFNYVTRDMRVQGARNSAALVRRLSSSPDPVMSEDMTLLYKAGKQLPFEPAIVTELAAVHIWDETPLVDMIRSQRFSVMILGSDPDWLHRYSPAVMHSILENYQPTETYAEFSDSFTVYVPSSRASSIKVR